MVPKIVDHDQRRRELGDAIFAVIIRDGLHAASIRTVAKESGWSAGAIRHYFGTHTEMIEFVIREEVRRAKDEFATALQQSGPPLRRAQLPLEVYLPLDARQRAAFAIWTIEVHRLAVSEDILAVLSEGTYRSIAWTCRRALAVLHGLDFSHELDAQLPAALEPAALDLHIWLDGLALQGFSTPEIVTPAVQRTKLRAKLNELAPK